MRPEWYRIIVAFRGRGLKLKEDWTWEGRLPYLHVGQCFHLEGVGAAISSSSGLIFIEGSASFNLVRCMVGDGVSGVMLCDYKVIIRGEGILAGAVGLCNLP